MVLFLFYTILCTDHKPSDPEDENNKRETGKENKQFAEFIANDSSSSLISTSLAIHQNLGFKWGLDVIHFPKPKYRMGLKGSYIDPSIK